MYRFKYYVDLKENCELFDRTEADISFVIEAKNRAAANRIVKAMLKDAPNVKAYDGVCID